MGENIDKFFKDNLISHVKKNKKAFKQLKGIAVSLQNYELVAELREIEKELFPETEIEKHASQIVNALALVDIRVPPDMAWIIYKTIKCYEKKKGSFSLKDACQIKIESKENFEE